MCHVRTGVMMAKDIPNVIKIANLAIYTAMTAGMMPKINAKTNGGILVDMEGAISKPEPAPINPPERPIAGFNNVPPATSNIIAVTLAMAGTMYCAACSMSFYYRHWEKPTSVFHLF
jgi:hypothetical protein